MSSIKMSKPCPMTLGRISKGNNEFHCSSCSKNLIDFRDFSEQGIIDYFKSNDSCGIFDQHQIATPKFSRIYRMRYLFLTLLAVIGLNVKPLAAQSSEDYTFKEKRAIKKELRLMKKEEKKQASESMKPPKTKKRRRRFLRRKKRYRTIGTPAFEA